MSTDLSSIFPDWSQLDFARNCSSYGQWLAAFIAPNPWTPEEALGGSIPLSIILMSHSLPPGWTFNDSSAPNSTGGQGWAETIESPAGTAYFSDVMQWFVAHIYHTYNASNNLWYADPQFVDNVVWSPADKCGREFCKAIAFTGNADLSGIGIVISYYIEASLTTLYLFIFTGWRLWGFVKRRRQDKKSQGLSTPPKQRGWFMCGCHRAFDALRGTFDSFFTAATVLALAILIAVIVLETNHIHENHRNPVDAQNIPSGHALYDSALGLLVGLYAVFPVVVLYSVLPEERELANPSQQAALDHEHAQGVPATLAATHATHTQEPEPRGRRTWLRRGGLIVLWALVASIVFLDPRSELDYEYQGYIPPDDGDGDSSFAVALYACDQRGGLTYWRVLKSLPYLVIGVPALWLLLTAVVYAVTGKVWRRARRAASEAKNDTTSSEKRARGEGRPPVEDEESPKNAFQRFGRPVWRHLVAWVAAAIMWTILLSLTELRHNIIVVADGLDTENDWEFGQVLAVATWGPPFVDFMFLLIFGIEAGLAGRLPLDFTIRHVVSASEVDVSSGNDDEGPIPDGGLVDRTSRDKSRADSASPTQTRASVSGSSPVSPVSSIVSRNTASHGNQNDGGEDDSKAAIVHETNRDPSALSPDSGPQTTTQAAAPQE
ncbi:hypothetical protein SEUCBS139899_000883 [Sporothrix eucalyptigena]|uniref:Uncharacterized protein n=1 Tax=Sporothrix eucalyptigena TaxID=1812306 RepID=A0ABP0BK92_9PEZI